MEELFPSEIFSFVLNLCDRNFSPMAFLSNKQCHKRDVKTGQGFQFQKVAQFIEALKFKWDMLNLG